MFLSALISQQIMTAVPSETVILAVILSVSLVNASYVDYSYCRKYASDPIDRADHKDERGLPLLYMGSTWDKEYYITTKNFTANFFRAAFNQCDRFGYGLRIASIRTVCEYGILDRWFKDHFPTDYSCWLGGLRLGFFGRPFWIQTREQMDMSQFNVDVDFINGQYPPGGYSPIAYPWNNCLCVNRNCPIYTSGPTNPCKQTETYPEIQFSWDNCRGGGYRTICERLIYGKKETEEEIENRLQMIKSEVIEPTTFDESEEEDYN